MLLVFLIVAIWTAGMLLVAALCTAARRGDQVIGGADAPQPGLLELREAPARGHEPAEPAVRAAA
jgi:hypothetical protein